MHQFTLLPPPIHNIFHICIFSNTYQQIPRPIYSNISHSEEMLMARNGSLNASMAGFYCLNALLQFKNSNQALIYILIRSLSNLATTTGWNNFKIIHIRDIFYCIILFRVTKVGEVQTPDYYARKILRYFSGNVI